MGQRRKAAADAAFSSDCTWKGVGTKQPSPVALDRDRAPDRFSKRDSSKIQQGYKLEQGQMDRKLFDTGEGMGPEDGGDQMFECTQNRLRAQ